MLMTAMGCLTSVFGGGYMITIAPKARRRVLCYDNAPGPGPSLDSANAIPGAFHLRTCMPVTKPQMCTEHAPSL